MRQYIAAQRAGTAWLAARMPAMRAYVTTHLRHIHDHRRLAHPERTLSSYVWQEAEAISREAKLRWARVGGHIVHNLQHDGVIVSLSRGTREDAARALSEVCGRALGHTQPVTVDD